MSEQRSVRVFISYRRDDSEGYAGRLYDSLVKHFGPRSLFMDIDSIGPGEDFSERINQTLLSCDVFLPVIGRQWLTVVDDNGRRRLSNPRDWVRLEIQTALEHGIRVIPVLVQGAAMPAPGDLPRRLAPLSRRNAFPIGRRWHTDVEHLVETIGQAVESMPAPVPVAPAPVVPAPVVPASGPVTAIVPPRPAPLLLAPPPPPASSPVMTAKGSRRRARMSVLPIDALALLAVCVAVATLVAGLLQSGLTLLYLSLGMAVVAALFITLARVRHRGW